MAVVELTIQKGGIYYNMKEYGYVRCSTQEQNLDRQMIAMAEKGVAPENIFMDKVSGKNFDRQAYQKMFRKLKSGDLLYVLSIDRLGRSYEDLQIQWKKLTKEKGVDIVVIDMPLLDTRAKKDLLGTFVADLTLGILSFIAENERTAIRKRQFEGIAAAKARGVRFGRPIKKPPENFGELVKQWERGKLSFSDALKQTGFKQATFYNRLREYRQRKKK